jgi:hypothetical protein
MQRRENPMTTRWTMAVQIGAVACALAVSAEAGAATIYGFIHENNQPVVKKELVLKCGEIEAAKALTDERGNYRITTAHTGRCNLVIDRDRASGEVVLYAEPTQYNFDIIGRRLIRR